MSETQHALVAGKAPTTLFASSVWIWCGNSLRDRNQFVSFVLPVFRRASSGDCWLHLFADTRYRLFVNEEFVAYGPARFVTQFPEYDSHPLHRYLREGENLVRVEVNYYGASSFQSMPDGRPGFIAAGGDAEGTVDFATPGEWQARRHSAWDADAPLFSFAQNPAEICDTRLLDEELDPSGFAPVSPLEEKEIPWGDLRPRQVPYPDYAPLPPKKVAVAGRLADGKRLLAVQSIDPELPGNKGKERLTQRLLSWIWSPRAHECALDCLWVDLELNGDPVERTGATGLGNHEIARLPLREGWNLFCARGKVLSEYWTLLFGYPKEEEISWHALPDRAVENSFLVSPVEAEELPLPEAVPPESFAVPGGWLQQSGDPNAATPARLMAWDEFPDGRAVRDLEIARLPEVASLCGESVSWCLSFEDEYYGHPVIEVEAPPGSILDVAYDDWQRADGLTNLYSSNPFTDAADRFYLRGGRQRIVVANPRGGIYLQVTLRSPNGKVDFRLHSVNVLSRRTLRGREDAFRCANPVFEWSWQRSLHTLVASTDEGYADCPWRERGSYVGDSFVNLHVHALLSSDLRVARRVFRIFGEAQLENGQLAPVAPAWHRKPHEDFSLIWLLCLRDYWSFSGDTELLAEMWPRVERLWKSPTWEPGPQGLWNACHTHIFCDWGKLSSEVAGEANAVLNLFRMEAARATAQIARVLGRPEAARRFEEEAKAVRAALEALLWDAEEGRFHASLGAGTPAMHANVLALRFGAGDPGRLLAYLEPLLKGNFRHGIDHGQGTGFIELYFMIYLLPALAEHGRHDLAEALIEEHYGFLQGLGHPTLNECFSRAHRNVGSCCHSWSGAAAVYLARYLMGFRQRGPGCRDAWILDPVSPSLDGAEATFPHEKGSIHVAWERTRPEGPVHARVTAPEGVTVTPAEHVELQMQRRGSPTGA